MYRGKGRDMQINTQTSAAGYPGTGAAGIFSTKVYSAKNTEAAEASKRAEKEPTDQEQFRLATDAYKENHRLTVEKTKKEDDWREMTDEQWDKLVDHVDKYIDEYKEELEAQEEIEQEAAEKAAAEAPAGEKEIAAASAALAAAGGNPGAGAADTESSMLEKMSWTYNINTDDQTILAKAKMANEYGPDMLTKAQELALTGQTTEGTTQTGSVVESASSKEEDDGTKTWTITAFTPDGIICNECSDGKTKELWRLDYKNSGDCQKVWDYLAKFDKDEELDFASDKKFWEGFLGM